jgi:hypothetical protein
MAAQTSPTVFTACYVPVVGALYRIKATGLPSACVAANHVEFTWTDADSVIRLGDTASGDLNGTYPAPTVAQLQGTAMSATAPTSGQALVFDGTSWVPTTPPSGVTDHGALTGLTDDDHPLYALADGVRSTTNGFALTGTVGSGTIPISGAGTRLMWYPGKGAFRAGSALVAEWDDAAIGNNSTAMGLATTASGDASTAMGFNTTAGGVTSTALGEETIASGAVSTAMGFGTAANGLASTAMGFNTTASGDYSTAMGSFASTNNQVGAFVSGDNSTTSVLLAPAPNSFTVRAAGGYSLYSNDLLTSGVTLAPGGGSWASVSDRNLKENFQDVDGEQVLTAIASMPLQSWSYKSQDPSIRHIGPMAQDFYAAFGLGLDDRRISTIDADGINLLAVQALEARTSELKRDLEALRAENRELKTMLAELAAAMQRLQTLVATGNEN